MTLCRPAHTQYGTHSPHSTHIRAPISTFQLAGARLTAYDTWATSPRRLEGEQGHPFCTGWSFYCASFAVLLMLVVGIGSKLNPNRRDWSRDKRSHILPATLLQYFCRNFTQQNRQFLHSLIEFSLELQGFPNSKA